MGIVSDLPFEFVLQRVFTGCSNKNVNVIGTFFDSEEEAWEHSQELYCVEENEEVEVLFNALDKEARLYLEALDIIPPNEGETFLDEEGRLYRKPSNCSFFLYKHNDGYDALCIDTFLIVAYCNGRTFFSTLRVGPKPFSEKEWGMMKDDLENEITGLAQDLVRRKLGLGKSYQGKLPSKILHDFIVMQKYSKKILPALIDIVGSPRYQIVTRYKKTLGTKNYHLDEKSVRRYITRAGSESFYQVPEKIIDYDIQDNRILKMILQNYESRLNEFIEIIKNDLDYELIENGSRQYRTEWLRSIKKFESDAKRLKKLTVLIKTAEWYSVVKDVSSPYIPHSFFMDNRYNVLYQMYNEMREDSFKIDFDPEYSYTWKKSSYLYEMWCFIKICRLLEKSFDCVSGDFLDIYVNKMFFPFLHSGTEICFSNDNIRLDVIYNILLPYSGSNTNLESPLYMARTQDNRHNRPDILINVYDKHSNWYIGSIVFECKYRKINSFLGKGDWSSIQQFQAYYNNSRSKYQYNGKGQVLDIRPVNRVIVLTPDQKGDGIKMQDFKIDVKGFKPSDNNRWLISLNDQILEIVADMLEREKVFMR